MLSPPVPLPAVKSPPWHMNYSAASPQKQYMRTKPQQQQQQQQQGNSLCANSRWQEDMLLHGKRSCSPQRNPASGSSSNHVHCCWCCCMNRSCCPNCWVATVFLIAFTSVMTRWKLEPLKCRGFPDLPVPFSPARRCMPRAAEQHQGGNANVPAQQAHCCLD